MESLYYRFGGKFGYLDPEGKTCTTSLAALSWALSPFSFLADGVGSGLPGDEALDLLKVSQKLYTHRQLNKMGPASVKIACCASCYAGEPGI